MLQDMEALRETTGAISACSTIVLLNLAFQSFIFNMSSAGAIFAVWFSATTKKERKKLN